MKKGDGRDWIITGKNRAENGKIRERAKSEGKKRERDTFHIISSLSGDDEKR